MRNILFSPWGKLALALVLLATSFTLITPPAVAAARCCEWETQTFYFSDAAKTVPCGSCFQPCGGPQECEGVTSPYFNRIRTCCGVCNFP